MVFIIIIIIIIIIHLAESSPRDLLPADNDESPAW